MQHHTGALLVRDLHIQSPRGRKLLHADHLELDAGQSLGIKGPSGAGKSTLLFALAGIQPNATGTVRWGIFDLVASTEKDSSAFRRTHLGIVFQDFLLFDELGPLENGAIQALFQPKTARKALWSAAQKQLNHLGVARDTDDVTSYSGGERQRISIARALAHNPAILLADEPTANLDRDAADALATDLVSQSKTDGRTLIVVSHDPAVLDQMDRVVTVKDGSVT
ncbi:MAG: ABC transporter ATP-binding protein [Cognatishimia sp.]|uniref:ABC transporter ATP-binding protein n=1 Tax=Cognatishimia sp. TaxID=2211648 RepID=UPI003B8C3E11